MTAKSSTVSMTAIAYHEHYDPQGRRVAHAPGEVYELADGGGMTAAQLAESFIALRVARRTADMTGKPAADEKGTYRTTELGETRQTTLTPKAKK